MNSVQTKKIQISLSWLGAGVSNVSHIHCTHINTHTEFYFSTFCRKFDIGWNLKRGRSLGDFHFTKWNKNGVKWSNIILIHIWLKHEKNIGLQKHTEIEELRHKPDFCLFSFANTSLLRQNHTFCGWVCVCDSMSRCFFMSYHHHQPDQVPCK